MNGKVRCWELEVWGIEVGCRVMDVKTNRQLTIDSRQNIQIHY